MPSDVLVVFQTGWFMLRLLKLKKAVLIGCIHLWTSIVPLPPVAKCVVTGRREASNSRQLSCLPLNVSLLSGDCAWDATADHDVDVRRLVVIGCWRCLIRIAPHWSVYRLAGCLISLRRTRAARRSMEVTRLISQRFVSGRRRLTTGQSGYRGWAVCRSPHPAERVRDAVGWLMLLPDQWASLFCCFMTLYRRFYGNS